MEFKVFNTVDGYTEEQEILDAMMVCSRPDQYGISGRTLKANTYAIAKLMRKTCNWQITDGQMESVASNLVVRFDP